MKDKQNVKIAVIEAASGPMAVGVPDADNVSVWKARGIVDAWLEYIRPINLLSCTSLVSSRADVGIYLLVPNNELLIKPSG